MNQETSHNFKKSENISMIDEVAALINQSNNQTAR